MTSLHPIAPFAREAFAAGWAASGGPMTDRVKTASLVAVALAVEHAVRPDILETTLKIGSLEGMWAKLFARRDQRIAQYTASTAAAWRRLVKPRMFRDTLHHLRAELDLREDGQDHKRIRAAADAAARSILQALPLTPGWAALRAAIRDALAAGRAEGIVNAVAVAAERAGTIGLDWDVAFDHAYQQLERLDELWSDAEGWLARTVDRAAADLGRVLADQAQSGGSSEDMLDAAMAALDSDDVEAVSFVVDWAMTTAADQGALSLYRLHGVQDVDWITAGGARVCATCLANESGSPWPITAVPKAPAHPLCRCVLAADLDLAKFSSWFTT